MSSELQLTDVINTAVNRTESLRNAQAEAELSSSLEINESSPKLAYIMQHDHSFTLKNVCWHSISALDPADVSLERAESMIPDDMYTFMFWLLTSDATVTLDSVNRDDIKVSNIQLHRQILSVCQDIIYIGSRGKCRTPKHVGLGIALHQLTQSRDAVTVVNKHGHGISYNEVDKIDLSWAVNQMTPDGYAAPTNMVPGIPIRAAGDNFNRATETLDGQHLDVVNMVLCQADSNTIAGTFGPRVKPAAVVDKSTQGIQLSQILPCPRIGGKRPGPSHLLKKVNLDWFFNCSDEYAAATAIDSAYIQLRLRPTKLFEADIQRIDIK